MLLTFVDVFSHLDFRVELLGLLVVVGYDCLQVLNLLLRNRQIQLEAPPLKFWCLQLQELIEQLFF